MASNANTAAVEDSSINGEENNPAWCNFWHDLKEYIHPSWLEPDDSLNVDINILSADTSSFIWKQFYPTLCEQYGLGAKYPLGRDDVPKFWKEYLPQLVKAPMPAATFAGVAFLIQNNLTLPAMDSEDDVNDAEKLSLPLKRNAYRIGQCLMLQRRFEAIDSVNPNIVGLWLLSESINDVYPPGWRRVRLAFDKSLVLGLESMTFRYAKSDAGGRCLKRLWVMVKEELAA